MTITWFLSLRYQTHSRNSHKSINTELIFWHFYYGLCNSFSCFLFCFYFVFSFSFSFYLSVDPNISNTINSVKPCTLSLCRSFGNVLFHFCCFVFVFGCVVCPRRKNNQWLTANPLITHLYACTSSVAVQQSTCFKIETFNVLTWSLKI